MDEFDFFWNITANSEAMKDKCYAEGRRLMFLGIVKIKMENNDTIPPCPYPPEDVNTHNRRCMMGFNIYTKLEHTGFNPEKSYIDSSYPKFPENSTFMFGKNVSKDLEMYNLTTTEDILKHAYEGLASYTNKPYPGTALFYPPDNSKPSFPVCTPCHSDTILATFPILSVRGLCDQTSFDKKFTMVINSQGYVDYIGLRKTLIKYNLTTQVWMIQSILQPEIMATSKAVFSTLLIGKHTWQVSNDISCQAGEMTQSVKLSTCVKGEFTCGDGECIHIDQRCDRAKHCKDWSDEIDCNIVQMPQGYLKEFVPIELEDDLSIRKVETVVGVSIEDVINIFEKDGSIGLRFILTMEWKDARVEFLNLRSDSKRNLLSKAEKNSIWTPSLVFYNTLNKEETELDYYSNLFVKMSGGFVYAQPNVIDEAMIFQGSENSFFYERTYMKTFICEFNMGMYPFDTQRCTVDLRIKPKDESFISLTVGELDLQRSKELMQYIIIKYEMINNKNSTVELSVTLGRKVLSQMLTIYLPSALIIVVVYSTNFLKQFFFEAIVSVNLTAMLVLTTIFLGVSGDLPTTSYVKYVEIWLLFCLFVPFVYVLLHIYIDSLRVGNRIELARAVGVPVGQCSGGRLATMLVVTKNIISHFPPVSFPLH